MRGKTYADQTKSAVSAALGLSVWELVGNGRRAAALLKSIASVNEFVKLRSVKWN